MAKAKSTACASKKNKTFHRKAFCTTFHGSANLFEKYDRKFIKSIAFDARMAFLIFITAANFRACIASGVSPGLVGIADFSAEVDKSGLDLELFPSIPSVTSPALARARHAH